MKVGEILAKKIYIKNAKDLEGFIANQIANNLFFSSNLQDKTAEIMQENIIKNVYDAFEPRKYQRRGKNDNNTEAFSHMDNMEFTSVDIQNGNVRFVFENTAEGNDSMSGKELTDMFENGTRENWDAPNVTDDYGRVASDPRPFIQSTIDDLNKSKGELVDALKKDLRGLGFQIKN